MFFIQNVNLDGEATLILVIGVLILGYFIIMKKQAFLKSPTPYGVLFSLKIPQGRKIVLKSSEYQPQFNYCGFYSALEQGGNLNVQEVSYVFYSYVPPILLSILIIPYYWGNWESVKYLGRGIKRVLQFRNIEVEKIKEKKKIRQFIRL